MIKLTHISDTHGYHNLLKLSGGDILIHSGDIADFNKKITTEETIEWIHNTPYKYKIIVHGNHDESIIDFNMPDDVILLNNKIVDIMGIKFYGVSANLIEVNGIYRFSQVTEEQMELQDEHPDILITHGPPKGILDNKLGVSIGSTKLLEYVKERRPKYHLFGHAHHSKGIYNDGHTTYANSSIVYRVYPNIISGVPLDIMY